MAAARLDHPVLISAEQIRRREFVTTRRGYDPDQVRSYLVGLADQIDVMASMIREARMEAETAVRPIAQPHADPARATGSATGRRARRRRGARAAPAPPRPAARAGDGRP